MTSRRNAPAPRDSEAPERPATLFGVVPEASEREDVSAEQTTDARIARARQRAPKDQPNGAMIRGQWERAQKDLARVQIAREREAEQTKATLAKLHQALQIAQEEESLQSRSRQQKVRRVVLISTTVFAVLIAGVFGLMKFVPGAAQSAPVATSAEPLKQADAARINKGPQTAFSKGIGRLNQAFSRFPDSDPQDIIRAVNKKSNSTVCAFAWNAGQPALQYGAEHGGSLSLAGSLTKCAEAVEQFR